MKTQTSKSQIYCPMAAIRYARREALGAGQLFAGGDLHVLIGNNAVQLHVGGKARTNDRR